MDVHKSVGGADGLGGQRAGAGGDEEEEEDEGLEHVCVPGMPVRLRHPRPAVWHAARAHPRHASAALQHPLSHHVSPREVPLLYHLRHCHLDPGSIHSRSLRRSVLSSAQEVHLCAQTLQNHLPRHLLPRRLQEPTRLLDQRSDLSKHIQPTNL